MEIIDMITKRKLKKMMSVLFISGCFFIGNTKCKGADLEYISQETANYAVQERGYDLPVDEVVKEEAIEDCKNVMNQMKVIYQKADKGTSSNIVVSETVMEEMQEVLKEKNVPVITSAPYSNMANYSKMEEFLFKAEQDLPGDIVLYRINRDGGIERLKFNYDGTDSCLGYERQSIYCICFVYKDRRMEIYRKRLVWLYAMRSKVSGSIRSG